jgi:hypothetical protein
MRSEATLKALQKSEKRQDFLTPRKSLRMLQKNLEALALQIED